jgi:formate dehydrogenase alpha subunit
LPLKLAVDGAEVEVADGSTLLDACRAAGRGVETLCYMDGLPARGACRVCVVEVEGQRTLAASCCFPAAPGLKVRTDTERVKSARQVCTELILADHDTRGCETDQRCDLHDLASRLGIEKARFAPRPMDKPKDETSNPFVGLDPNKCIVCGRCVEVCTNVQVCDVLVFAQRGSESLVMPAFDVDMKKGGCVECGSCVTVCPTAALTDLLSKGAPPEREMEKVDTVCGYCGIGCGIQLNVQDGQLVKVTVRPDHPVNQFNTCVKGKYGYDFVTRPDRLKRPLLRATRDEPFREVSWEEAIAYVASKLLQFREESGPDSIGILSSAKCTNEENYLIQKWARACLGTKNVDNCTRLCHSSTVAAMQMTLGTSATSNSLSDIIDAEVFLITGSNTNESHPVVAGKVREAIRKRGAKLILVEPREIGMANHAHIWLRPRPGTDLAWINGFAHVILRDRLHNKEFVEKRTEGFDKLWDAVKEFSPARVEELTGIPAGDLERAAKLYATARTAMEFHSMGITQHVNGTDNALALINLVLLTGHIGKRGAGFNPLRGQNNVQGGSDVGAIPYCLPGYERSDNDDFVRKYSDYWGKPVPKGVGLTVEEMLRYARDRKLLAMLIMGENPMMSDADLGNVAKAIDSLEFLVVQDIFMTETAKRAHVVLPAASFAEKDGTVTNTERRVQIMRKAIEPPGEARADWEILQDLSTVMGYPMSYSHPKEIFEELRRVVWFMQGMTWERLGRDGLQGPCTDESHPGSVIQFQESFPIGRGKLTPVRPTEPAEPPDIDYPFLLGTGRVLYHWHTGEITKRASLNKGSPFPYVEIHPRDASRLGVEDGDIVRVESRRGSVECRAWVTPKVQKGTVFMPMHFVEAAANTLTIPRLDPVAKIPSFKECAVRISRVGPPGEERRGLGIGRSASSPDVAAIESAESTRG